MIRILPGNDRCHDRYNVYVHELWFGESLCKMHRKKLVVYTFYFYNVTFQAHEKIDKTHTTSKFNYSPNSGY